MTKTLGILGGLGPAASVYFYQLITQHTEALCDQDHLDIILISKASIPDRTDYILGKSAESPLPAMMEGVKKLAEAGAQLIAIPCNTAHYFYDEIEKLSSVPVLNIVKETVFLAQKAGIRKLGIMATAGTVLSGTYQKVCASYGVESVLPCEASQQTLMDIIYKDIKTAKNPDMNAFLAVASELYKNGAEAIVLGCTELSLIQGLENYPAFRFIDSLHVLAFRAIQMCGKKACGFPAMFSESQSV